MSFQDINIHNMNVELVAQMFRNYQSNVLFHLEGESKPCSLTFESAFPKAWERQKDISGSICLCKNLFV